MEEKHPLNRTKEVSVDVVSSVDANRLFTLNKTHDFVENFTGHLFKKN
jgi:hypothetical protein